jgi:Ca2+/Na+ antiporter
MSILWLAILSYVMISCCDEIGSFIGASPIVMGLTLSAIGTSFPNLWSSMLVARQGLGDMAVGNAFGSNTFNICIALGLPWLTRSFVTGFSSYDQMEDDGIVFMLLLLILVTLIFYLIVMLHDWQIRKWSALPLVAHRSPPPSAGWRTISWRPIWPSWDTPSPMDSR